MSKTDFVDYYELLQLSPNADTDTVERVFRHLAKKLHPDNTESADPERFRLEKHRLRLRDDHLLTSGGAAPGSAEGQSVRSGSPDLLVSPKGTAFNR